MPTYLFQLGHQPHISIAEIKAVLHSNGFSFSGEKNLITYFEIATKDELPMNNLMQQLGGTVKILQLLEKNYDDSVIARTPTYVGGRSNPLVIEEDIANYLSSLPIDSKLNFSITGPNASRIAINVKKILKEAGKSVRYIEPKNTATILHNGLVESASDITLIENNIYITKAIQPIEDFTERDFGRPGSDSKSGMLPPKLARIMVNLAEPKANDVILDPFCGSGTILTEALSMGHSNLIGSDFSPKAIENTKKNIAWLRVNNKTIEQYNSNNVQFFQTDARELDKRIPSGSVNIIISEPYLGKPLTGRETKDQLTIQSEELRQLYLDSFRAFYKILCPGGTIIFIVPRFRVGTDWIVIKCLNPIQKLGFKLVPFSSEHESLIYSRPQQFVAREIWKFIK